MAENESTDQPQPTTELQLALAARGYDISTNSGDVDDLTLLMADIIGIFSRADPQTGRHQMVSPSRAAQIPAITLRYANQLLQRGQFPTNDCILMAWLGNTPSHSHHPDSLFDSAKLNFGDDRPVGHIVEQVMKDYDAAQKERLARMAMYMSLAEAIEAGLV